MKYIITESQHENLKNSLSEVYILNSRGFVRHQGPNLQLMLNISPKFLVKEIEKVINKELKNLEDEYLLNDNLMSFDEVHNKVIDGIIDALEKKPRTSEIKNKDLEEVKNFFSTITLSHLHKIYKKMAGGLENPKKE